MKPLWMLHALGELGVHELPGARHNERIISYHQTCSLKATTDEVPWCSAFVNWCLHHTGIAGTDSARARSWTKWGREHHFEYGTIIVMSRGSNVAQGHVAFYIDGDDNEIFVLGGNQNNCVSIARYPYIRVVAARMP